MSRLTSQSDALYAMNGELGRTWSEKVWNYSLQACSYVRQKHVLALFLESRRPVLEQLELCVNSHVCGVEAVSEQHFKMLKCNLCTKSIHLTQVGAWRVLHRVQFSAFAQHSIVHNFTMTDLRRCVTSFVHTPT